MNTVNINYGGWRDSQLRKNLNDESNGTIWNAIQSIDFKNNITPVLKTTNNGRLCYNYYTCNNTSNSASITTDKLFILSPSEMGMPIIKNYSIIGYYGINQSDANVHYSDSNSYKNTIKSSKDGNDGNSWFTALDYIYDGDAYQWWMLPAGSRKMSNGNQAYHNTDQYSYCALLFSNPSSNPSTNENCSIDNDNYYWLRSTQENIFFSVYSVYSGYYSNGFLDISGALLSAGVVVSFSF